MKKNRLLLMFVLFFAIAGGSVAAGETAAINATPTPTPAYTPIPAYGVMVIEVPENTFLSKVKEKADS